MNINRRKFFQSLLGVVSISLLAPHLTFAQNKKKADALSWTNWSRNVQCNPERILLPKSHEQLAAIIKEANSPIRLVGAGHSFSPIAATNDTMISLGYMSDLNHIDNIKKTASIQSGARLFQLTDALWKNGLCLNNQPDINLQSLAGATATATHGSGRYFGSLSSLISQARIIDANGVTHYCDNGKNEELLLALGNHLGVLGAVSDLTFQAQKQLYLKTKSWMMSEDEAFAQADQLSQTHRHFEMFPLPHSDYILCVANDEISAEEAQHSSPKSKDDAFETFKLIQKLTDYVPSMKGFIINRAAETVDEEITWGPAHQQLNHVRSLFFNEMEYTVPLENGLACLKEVLNTIKKLDIEVIFPIEFRYTAAEKGWLSPFYDRAGCSISIHQFQHIDYKKYFNLIEPIFIKYGGRPHWGKIHNLDATKLRKLYKHWDDFAAIRKSLDPKGKFLNPKMRQLLVDS
ncbi:MAG: FAD-binding protein [Colwellia sp.]|nr:FAD-binding protein [Colwellia sp.]